MRYLLTGAGRRELERWLQLRPLLGFDLDGTLAPIGRDPRAVALPPRVRSLLADVARRFPVIVISGRAQRDVLPRLDGVPVVEVYGNHGLEPLHASSVLRDRVAGWKEFISRRLSGWERVWVEDKQYSLTIHYRNAPEPVWAARAARITAEALGGVRIVAGERCLHVLPAGLADRGQVLLHAQRKLACPTAIYFGDDKMDEDIFAGCNPAAVLGIRIGPDPGSRARYYLHWQTEMEAVLELIAKDQNT